MANLFYQTDDKVIDLIRQIDSMQKQSIFEFF
jgi:hypothetical protein